MLKFLKKYRYQIILGLMICAYISYFSLFTLMRHQKLQSNYYDLGIMNQTVYNTYHGRLLELTNPTGSQTIKRMAIHNDILLAFLAPFYAIYSGPETLLIIQTIVLALGAIPLFLLAKKILKSHFLALILAFSYLMYPPLQRSNIFDFHAVTLATTLLLWMFYLWTEKKYRTSFIFMVLAMLSKEQVALTTSLFGLFIIFQNRHKPNKAEFTFGLSVFLISAVWFVVSFWAIIPHFRQADHFALSRYKEFGDTTSGIIKGFFLKPVTTLTKIFSFPTVRYIFLLSAPLFFLSFLSPFIALIPLPDLLINIISSEPNMQDIIHHYTAVITPFIFISAIYGIVILQKKYRFITNAVVAFLIMWSTLAISFAKSPLPYSREKNTDPFGPVPPVTHDLAVWQKLLENENIAVSATDTFAAHLSNRKTIMRFGETYNKADYVVLTRKEVFNGWLDWYNMPYIYTQLKTSKQFTLVYKHNDFEVYKKI